MIPHRRQRFMIFMVFCTHYRVSLLSKSNSPLNVTVTTAVCLQHPRLASSCRLLAGRRQPTTAVSRLPGRRDSHCGRPPARGRADLAPLCIKHHRHFCVSFWGGRRQSRASSHPTVCYVPPAARAWPGCNRRRCRLRRQRRRRSRTRYDAGGREGARLAVRGSGGSWKRVPICGGLCVHLDLFVFGCVLLSRIALCCARSCGGRRVCGWTGTSP